MSNEGDEPMGRSLAPDVKRALAPGLAGFVGLVLLAFLNVFLRDDDSGGSAITVVAVAVAIIVLGAMVVGGYRAGKAFREIPLESGVGRFAVRMAVALAVVLVVLVVTFGILAATDTWERDSEPFLGFWVVLALVASLIGAFAPEPGRRGLLILPFLLGVGALVLLLSEVTGIS